MGLETRGYTYIVRGFVVLVFIIAIRVPI